MLDDDGGIVGMVPLICNIFFFTGHVLSTESYAFPFLPGYALSRDQATHASQ